MLLMVLGALVALTVLSSPASAYLGPPIAVQPNHDYPAPMDYNGDGNLDPTVVRLTTPATRGQLQWYIYPLGPNQPIDFGLPGDVPVPGNYSKYGGDLLSDDIAVWRPSNGTWYIRTFNGTSFVTLTIQWGLNGDYPLPYQSGSSHFDLHEVTLTVFRPSDSGFFVYPTGSPRLFNGSSAPASGGYQLNEFSATHSICNTSPISDMTTCTGPGLSPEFYQNTADKVYDSGIQYSYGLAGDYAFTYDFGLLDFPNSCSAIGYDQVTSAATSTSIIRNSGGNDVWYIRKPNGFTAVKYTSTYGLSTDIPVPGHYFGGYQEIGGNPANPVPNQCTQDYNDQTNLAVWRPSNGTWYMKDATGASHSIQWGLPW